MFYYQFSDTCRISRSIYIHTCLYSSRTILEKYLKRVVLIAGNLKDIGKKSLDRQCQTHFHLAHYADALFRSHEERLNSTEWQAAMRLRKHKGEKTDYSMKILELQKQLTMDKEEAEKLQVLKLSMKQELDVFMMSYYRDIPFFLKCNYNISTFKTYRWS
ncbi:hypothetical protein V2J09_006732 [Rumex salicifolius]